MPTSDVGIRIEVPSVVETQGVNTNETDNGNRNNISHEMSSLESGSHVNNSIFDPITTERNVKAAVKSKLFPVMKFITNNDELDYSNDAYAISKIICDENNIAPDDAVRMSYWNVAKRYVPRNLNIRRTAVTSAIEGRYKGK